MTTDVLVRALTENDFVLILGLIPQKNLMSFLTQQSFEDTEI